MSGEQVNVRSLVLDVVEEEDRGEGVPLGVVVREVEREEPMSLPRVLKVLEQLHRHGEIYQNAGGRLRRT